MWQKFKHWLCEAEYQRMEEWLERERRILHDDYLHRANYLDDKYSMVMDENVSLRNLIMEGKIYDTPTLIINKPE